MGGGRFSCSAITATLKRQKQLYEFDCCNDNYLSGCRAAKPPFRAAAQSRRRAAAPPRRGATALPRSRVAAHLRCHVSALVLGRPAAAPPPLLSRRSPGPAALARFAAAPPRCSAAAARKLLRAGVAILNSQNQFVAIGHSLSHFPDGNRFPAVNFGSQTSFGHIWCFGSG